MDRTAIKLIMKLRYDISIGPKNEGNAILVKNRLIVAAFHLQTDIRFFLVRLRYTGTIISSAATVLEAYSSASASAESLTDVLFLPNMHYLIAIRPVSSSILMPVISSDSSLRFVHSAS